MIRFAVLFFFFIAFVIPVSAAPKTLLQLDTGGHMALIRDMVFTPDGKQLISASDDKTIRVWDLETGQTVRMIRGESIPGSVGKIYSLALSPDGKWLVVGGQTRDHEIRVYEFQSGRLAALLKGHSSSVITLAFSPDGKQLISGSLDKTAIIWDFKKLKIRRRLKGAKHRIDTVGFISGGKYAVGGAFRDGFLVWRVSDGRQIEAEKINYPLRYSSEYLDGFAVSRHGKLLLKEKFGDRVVLWDTRNSSEVKKLGSLKSKNVTFLFSPDSKYVLLAAENEGYQLFNTITGKKVATNTIDSESAHSIAISPDNRWVAIAGGNNNEIQILDLLTGDYRRDANGFALLLRGVGQSVKKVGISPDGEQIGWGHPWLQGSTGATLKHVFKLPTLQSGSSEPQNLDAKLAKKFTGARYFTETGFLEHLGNSKNTESSFLDIILSGKRVASLKSLSGSPHVSYTFTPDTKIVVSGGFHGSLAAFDTKGQKLGDFIGHKGAVWSIAVSPDGRFLVSGSSDQTVRLWNVKTRELLATLFYGQNDEWLLWTPEGFFMGSESGGKLVGWQVNQGPAKEARYVNAAQLRRIFYRPDLVAAKLNGDPDGKVKRAARRFNVENILRSGSAPVLAFVASSKSWETYETENIVKIRIKNTGGGVGQVFWKVNGQLRGKTKGHSGINKLKLTLGKGENIVEAVAFNKAGFIQSQSVQIKVRVREKVFTGKPDLYVLAVGVDEYFDSRFELEYSVRDATQLVKVLKAAATTKEGKGFYQNVRVKTLTNAQVTRENMTTAFEDMGKTMRPNDVFVFFIAGHGKTSQGDYYFIPPSFKNVGLSPIESQGFGPKDWEEWTTHIKAEKSLLMFDTCEAGSIARIVGRGAEQLTAYERLKDRTGRVILMATNQREVALEGYKEKHGVLTYAMLEAIALSDRDKDKQIMLTELIGYVADRVPQMSCELTQEPGKACYRQVPQANLSGAVFPIVPLYEKAHPEQAGSDGVLTIGDAYPGLATHFSMRKTALFDKAGGKVLKTLPAGYQVRKVSGQGSHVLVARNGVIIGYVAKDALLKIQ